MNEELMLRLKREQSDPYKPIVGKPLHWSIAMVALVVFAVMLLGCNTGTTVPETVSAWTLAKGRIYYDLFGLGVAIGLVVAAGSGIATVEAVRMRRRRRTVAQPCPCGAIPGRACYGHNGGNNFAWFHSEREQAAGYKR